MTKLQVYELIKVLENDLADGIHFGSARNDEILQLAYLALHKQEAAE